MCIPVGGIRAGILVAQSLAINDGPSDMFRLKDGGMDVAVAICLFVSDELRDFT